MEQRGVAYFSMRGSAAAFFSGISDKNTFLLEQTTKQFIYHNNSRMELLLFRTVGTVSGARLFSTVVYTLLPVGYMGGEHGYGR